MRILVGDSLCSPSLSSVHGPLGTAHRPLSSPLSFCYPFHLLDLTAVLMKDIRSQVSQASEERRGWGEREREREERRRERERERGERERMQERRKMLRRKVVAVERERASCTDICQDRLRLAVYRHRAEASWEIIHLGFLPWAKHSFGAFLWLDISISEFHCTSGLLAHSHLLLSLFPELWNPSCLL